MGAAAYNRGSKAIREQIDREQAERRRTMSPERDDDQITRPPAPKADEPPARQPWTVGEKAYCIVHGAEGWKEVTDIKGPAYDQYIKIKGFRSWCPAYNFNRTGR